MNKEYPELKTVGILLVVVLTFFFILGVVISNNDNPPEEVEVQYINPTPVMTITPGLPKGVKRDIAVRKCSLLFLSIIKETTKWSKVGFGATIEDNQKKINKAIRQLRAGASTTVIITRGTCGTPTLQEPFDEIEQAQLTIANALAQLDDEAAVEGVQLIESAKKKMEALVQSVN